MTDKVRYTVTIEVEADAVGPAQAIKQALDWARDTESGPAVITVQASNLSPLRAAVADGRVAQLFTGPVHTGVDPAGGPDSTVHATIKQGVDPDKVRVLVGRAHKEAADLRGVARCCTEGSPMNVVYEKLAERLTAMADELETLTHDL